MQPRNRLILSVLLLVGLFVVGSIGYALIEGVSLSRAAYLMVVTLTTVGYGDVVPQRGAGRVWTAVMIVVGVAAAMLSLSSLQAWIVSGELRRLMGRRKLLSRIQQLSDHIIVCGYGRMGQIISADLRDRGQAVVVVDHDPNQTTRIEEEDLLYVLGDASEEPTLRQAGVMRARGLVSVLPHDAENVYVTLTARGLRSDLQIVARAEQFATEAKLHRAGANRVICPPVIGARMICNMRTRPIVTVFVEVAAKGVELEREEVLVGPESAIRDKSLRESGLRQRAGVMVVAIKRADGTTIYSPGPDVVVRQQDTLILIGPAGASAKLSQT
ncbi:MAG: potassium channel family protein [Phycisphaerae bacterium]